jgi:hypothetical protein
LHQQENQENLTAVNGSSAHSRHHRAEESEAMIAAAESSKKNTSHVMSVAKFERFFRIAAGLNVDKQGPQALQRFHQSEGLRPSGPHPGVRQYRGVDPYRNRCPVWKPRKATGARTVAQ